MGASLHGTTIFTGLAGAGCRCVEGGLARIAAAPDLTLEEIRAELAARGRHVGYGTVWRFFAAEGISFKKNRARQRTRAA